MNELTNGKTYLPETIPELSKFILVGREQLNAVRAAIRAIEKVGLAKEVLEQKKQEAQELAEAVLDAEVRTGELLKEIPKATSGNGSNQFEQKSTPMSNSAKPKSEVLKENNIPQKQAERYQFLADHKEQVEQAKTDARKNDRIVTRADVINKVRPLNDQKKFIDKVKAEHEEFKEQKVVGFQEIQIEKSNQKVLADKLEIELMSLANKIDFMEMDMDKTVVAAMDLTTKKSIISALNHSGNSLYKIIRKLGGN